MNQIPEPQSPPGAVRAYWGGRHHPDREAFTGELTVTRIRLDRGGYTKRGTYYGVGAPLFSIQDLDGDIDFELRAADRKTAWTKAMRAYPRAKLYHPRRKR